MKGSLTISGKLKCSLARLLDILPVIEHAALAHNPRFDKLAPLKFKEGKLHFSYSKKKKSS